MEAISVHKKIRITSSPQCSSGIVERAKLAFLAWGDFHPRSRFARSTIPMEKCGLLIVYSCSITRPLLRK